MALTEEAHTEVALTEPAHTEAAQEQREEAQLLTEVAPANETQQH